VSNPVLRRRHFFEGASHEGGAKDVVWLRPDGRELGADDWIADGTRAFGVFLPSAASVELDERGRPSKGDTLLLALNPCARAIRFTLPHLNEPERWEHTLCTAGARTLRLRGGSVLLAPYSLSLLTSRAAP
jgi:glycogen operon protein